MRMLAVAAALIFAVTSGCTRSAGGGASAAGSVASSPGCGCATAPIGSASSGTSGPSAPVALAPAPPRGGLVAATYFDMNGSGSIDAGDRVELAFSGAVPSLDLANDLALAPGDTLGQGASVVQPSPDRALVTLGASPALSIFATYSPGSPPGPTRTPASIAYKGGSPVTLYADAGSTFTYQGHAYTEPRVAHAYFGNLHSHTTFSDGTGGDPAAAWAFARNQAGLDFMCVSDHLEQLIGNRWPLTLQMADAANDPGHFVTLTGFEWGHGVSLLAFAFYNHANLIGARTRVDLVKTLSLAGFYAEAGNVAFAEGAVGKFNHPGLTRPGIRYDNWDGFAYDGRADRFMRLVRVEGNGSVQTKEKGFLPALEKGWHLSPTESQDNHRGQWGTLNDRRTGVWAAALTRDDIMKALREGRTFATDDKNATIQLVADGSFWMGSTIARSGSIRLTVSVADPDPQDGFDRIELVSRAGVVFTKSLNGATSGTLDATVDPAEDTYYWAHAVEQDGDELFSAPIFVDR